MGLYRHSNSGQNNQKQLNLYGTISIQNFRFYGSTKLTPLPNRSCDIINRLLVLLALMTSLKLVSTLENAQFIECVLQVLFCHLLKTFLELLRIATQKTVTLLF